MYIVTKYKTIEIFEWFLKQYIEIWIISQNVDFLCWKKTFQMQ